MSRSHFPVARLPFFSFSMPAAPHAPPPLPLAPPSCWPRPDSCSCFTPSDAPTVLVTKSPPTGRMMNVLAEELLRQAFSVLFGLFFFRFFEGVLFFSTFKFLAVLFPHFVLFLLFFFCILFFFWLFLLVLLGGAFFFVFCFFSIVLFSLPSFSIVFVGAKTQFLFECLK